MSKSKKYSSLESEIIQHWYNESLISKYEWNQQLGVVMLHTEQIDLLRKAHTHSIPHSLFKLTNDGISIWGIMIDISPLIRCQDYSYTVKMHSVTHFISVVLGKK